MDAILFGLSHALTPLNLAYCFFGVLIGTLVGVLPGLGPSATIAMLLPVTFAMPPVSAIIMLAGIYYGAQYGGSTTAILVNVPGEPSSVMTAVDGHKLARKGRAGLALSIAAIGSFVAGTLSTVFLAFLAPLLSSAGLLFGPAENFSLIVLALIGSIVLARGEILPALGMILLGLLLASVGQEVTSGMLRFTFGVPALVDGFGIVTVAIAIFGVCEVIRTLAEDDASIEATQPIGKLWPAGKELREVALPILRATGVGSILGILPGGGALLASFAAYMVEKRLARNQEEFGNGSLKGVAAAESANNAGAQTSFVPMLTLGIPSNPNMAMMIGALMLHGVVAGPALISEKPEIFWGVIASMWIGNLFLLVLNLPLVGLWAKLMLVPYRYMYPAILVFCAIGTYSLTNSVSEIWVLTGFAFFAFVLVKLGCELAPLILAFMLGPMLEENFRRAMMLASGDMSVFLVRPISLTLLLLSLVLIAIIGVPMIRKKREVAFE